jgi:hypothetical protein
MWKYNALVTYLRGFSDLGETYSRLFSEGVIFQSMLFSCSPQESVIPTKKMLDFRDVEFGPSFSPFFGLQTVPEDFMSSDAGRARRRFLSCPPITPSNPRLQFFVCTVVVVQNHASFFLL